MAERRMFAKSIVLSDAFLDMPLSARCLYFTLNMFADDDGFVGSPKGIMRQCGASNDDLKVLIAKRYVLAFESGVIVIKHWRINNYLQKDRYKETTYIEEKNTLTIDEKQAYVEKTAENQALPPMYTKCIQNVYTGKDSIGKERLGKESIGKVINKGAKKSIKDANLDTLTELMGGYNFSQIISAKLVEWYTYKAEQKKTITPTGMKTQLNKVSTMITTIGEDKVIYVLDESMANNYQGMIWDLANKTKSTSKNVNMTRSERVLKEMENW